MKFLYQLDDIYTTTPWYRPNSKTLCSSIKQICNLPEKKYFDVYILGGYWCNQSKDTWDVDLFVNLKKEYDLSYLKYLKQFMQKCTMIGFQNYILLDLTFGNSDYYLYYTDNYYVQNNNNENINKSKKQFNKDTINYFYGKFNKNTLKIINNKTILSYSRNIDNAIYKYGCYFIKNGTYTNKIKKYYDNNRIYYKPILIEDYYNTHYYSNNNNILLLIFLFIIYYLKF